MKKILTWTFLILSVLTLVATYNLLWYDYKEKSWYNETVNIIERKHADTTTVVCILATVHQPTSNYNADSIVTILNQFGPDLILVEEDTLVFETVHKGYNHTLQKPLFARLGHALGLSSPEEIEGRAICKYKISHPTVIIRPYDYEGRNALYATNNTFLKEAEVDYKLHHLENNRLLTLEEAKNWDTYNRMKDTLNQQSFQIPYAINQPGYYQLTERLQDYQYHQVAEIVNTHDSLKPYRAFYNSNTDFWDTRNKTMAKHIANFIKQYPTKRIMVLTGAMHKYYLVKVLVPLQEKSKFRLKEYYE